MTCTYSLEENEKVIAWVTKKVPWLVPQEVKTLEQFASPKADFPCYRLWPQSGIGAGAFAAILQDQRDKDKNVIAFEQEKYIWRQGI